MGLKMKQGLPRSCVLSTIYVELMCDVMGLKMNQGPA